MSKRPLEILLRAFLRYLDRKTYSNRMFVKKQYIGAVAERRSFIILAIYEKSNLYKTR